MKRRYIRKLMPLMLLVIGFLAGALVTLGLPANGWSDLPDGEYPDSVITGMVTTVTGPPERASPGDRVDERDIAVYSDRVVLDIKGAQWSTFTDTNSMDPIIDEGANAIQLVPKTANDIDVGDIISYESDYADGIIIHRVVHKGTDELGTYYVAQGDNNPASDPGRIRFNQIKRVVVAIIY